jgi:hypothetical protein
MLKEARKPSMDPQQEKLRQNKAVWNKDVSALVNDLIHFKKMMNGWPSKFFKERSRITSPIPADPATIIGSLANDFQEISNRGTSLIQEQAEYAKTRRQRQPKQLNLPLQQPQKPGEPAPAAAPPAPDLTKQLSLGLNASASQIALTKLASSFESKYSLEKEASNPFSRFIARILTPRMGFGEGARIRRLRRTMLDNCLKAYKDLKKLHKEIVRSSTASIPNSHKLMSSVWNNWNAVNRLFSTYKMMRPKPAVDVGDPLDASPDVKEDRKQNNLPSAPGQTDVPDLGTNKNTIKSILEDYMRYGQQFSPDHYHVIGLQRLNKVIEQLRIAPKDKWVTIAQGASLEQVYQAAIRDLNESLNTHGNTFKEVSEQSTTNKPAVSAPVVDSPVVSASDNVQLLAKAQLVRWLGKTRHQLVPGATSGTRLEAYNLIGALKKDLDNIMNIVERGFDEAQLEIAISQVSREMMMLRTMLRSLYFSEQPVSKNPKGSKPENPGILDKMDFLDQYM